MTEQEWLACTDPTPMLAFLRSEASIRQLKLFAAACCRRAEHLIIDLQRQRVVDEVERHADGRNGYLYYDLAHLAAIIPGEETAISGVVSPSGWEAEWARNRSRRGQVLAVTEPIVRSKGEVGEQVAQIHLFRDIFRNPFRLPPSLPPAVLKWNDATVRRIAEGIYEDRKMPEGTLDTGRLAILADALLDAGCDDEELIQHCRSEGPHVRGCWAVDLILGKS